MGHCHITVNKDVRLRLSSDPMLADQIAIITESPDDDAGTTWTMKVSSPHLPKGYHYQQDLILEGNSIRFKPDLDV